ncbi:hypothetical protein [Phenylobacterium sp. RIFCSPHIGHO2_01_FULL_69_31]|uniref:hypothetical protein n=1 Tax=Phenylobacterium sp. RIFCSPHIGHO2_01_FULL_69_31 TaxID=1801944 RepID=UPI0025F8C228|nr:hypothetical protein [Phenylobacterium sp. RIFCSPHIGHO2_01_FULL_69_31]
MALRAYEPISPQTQALLAPFFPRWKGDASEPVLSPPPVRPRPVTTAQRQLVEA